MSPLSSLLLLALLFSVSNALPLLQKSSPSPPSYSQLEDIPDLLPQLEDDEYPDVEKRDLEELYPYGIPSELMDLLPELPRTDRKPHLENSVLLSARQQILPYI